MTLFDSGTKFAIIACNVNSSYCNSRFPRAINPAARRGSHDFGTPNGNVGTRRLRHRDSAAGNFLYLEPGSRR